MLRALNNHFLLLDAQARLMALLKKRSNFHQNQIRVSDTCDRENLQVLYIMNLVSLVAFENFEWLLMTPAVICNNCNFTKQYWSNVLSNEFLGGKIWMLPAILSHVKCQWKVCYSKLKQGNFHFISLILEMKAKVFVKNLQSPVVILNYFFLRYLGDS